jgi:hypothetical protein
MKSLGVLTVIPVMFLFWGAIGMAGEQGDMGPHSKAARGRAHRRGARRARRRRPLPCPPRQCQCAERLDRFRRSLEACPHFNRYRAHGVCEI